MKTGMSKSNAKAEERGLDDSLSKTKKSRWVSLLAILVGVTVIFLIYRKTKNEPEANPPAVNADTSSHVISPPAVTGDTASHFIAPQNVEKVLKQLEGKWQRTDGGYVIELKNPSPDGKINVGYYNPKPIHVGRSGWHYASGKIIVAVELQDKNYPGSLYTLQFFPRENLLAGTYYQAVEKVSYDVEFTRMQ
jgi:hypothetical protein